MITHIKTKGFKGRDIDEDIGPKTIYTGNNTVGKSSRAAAIALTILGFVPFAANSSKQGGVILADYGTSDRMTTSVVCGGIEFERTFSRSESGTVSTLLRVDKKKFSKPDFQIELFKAGNPRIIDLSDFVSLSDAKKIDTLFGLYPPGIDLKNLDSEIEKSKAAISRYEESNRTALSTIKRLTESKSEVVLPAGSLAETKKAIELLTNGIKETQKALHTAEIKNAEEVATEKAVKATREETQANFNQVMADNTVPFVAEKKTSEKDIISEFKIGESVAGKTYYENNTNSNIRSGIEVEAEKSINKMISTMEKSGCQVCAAMLIAKMELKKFKGGAK